MRVSVRRAGVDDLPHFFDLGRRMIGESQVRFNDIDEAATREMIASLGNGYFMALAEDDEPIGMMTGQIGRHVFAPDQYVAHDIFYVTPERRGSSAAAQLVGALEDWARQVGAWRVYLSIHTGIRVETTSRFYQKLGYQFIGGNYAKEL